jgi:hypothetical protein
MIAAIAFTLVPEGLADIPGWEFALWMLIGVVIFLVGDAIVDRRFGTEGAGGSIGDRRRLGRRRLLTNSLMPFAFERGGALAGAATAVGFLLPVLNS